MASGWGLTVNVYTADESAVARASEILSRAAAGLTLEGLTVEIMLYPHEIEDAE